MSLFSSLTNRIFLASTLLVLVSIAVPVYFVTQAVTTQAETQLRTGLDEATSLVDEYGRAKFEDFVRVARLVADLPRLKAAVAEDHPPTALPIAEDYQQKVQADLFIVTGKSGRVLAQLGTVSPDSSTIAEILRSRVSDHETTWIWPDPAPGAAVLRVAAIPLLLDPGQERLGTLVVGFRLDQAVARIRDLTKSDIAVAVGSRILFSTLDASRTADLQGALNARGIFERRLSGEEYIGRVQPLGVSGDGGEEAVAIVLRSRTAHQQFLQQLYRRVAALGVAAVLVATLLGYGIARTVTRPLRAVTATMREMAATGNLASTVPTIRPWDDEDARLLATTFRHLTAALDRFQRESAQRQRLAALGRLSTVIAHEVRNPLMIIKTAVRSLRRQDDREVVEVAASIDEEVRRINRVVTDVLDFARPIKFDFAPADLNEICRDAAQAVQTGGVDPPIAVEVTSPTAPILTDAERLRAVLVNVLTNAQHAVRARNNGQTAAIRLVTQRAQGGRWRIDVADRGQGISAEDLPRLFEPFFTTRRTGSGLGLALSRNIVEGLGGTIVIDSQVNVGTTVRIELPDKH
jgi:signal transduction histidine kinase